MDTMLHVPMSQGQGDNYTVKQYSYDPDSAHTVEVLREVNENGELGSFGFTLNNERPPVVGTVVPGGPADRAGLKTQEVVIAVNAQDTTDLSHQEVVSIISNTKTAGVWLTICDPTEQNNVVGRLQSCQRDRLRFTRVSSLNSIGSFSTSSPAINRNMADSKYSKDDSPPRYQDLPNYPTRPNVGGRRMGGVTSGLSSTGYTSSAMVLGNKGHSPLQKKHVPQTNGHSPAPPGGRQSLQPRSSMPMNGYLSSSGKSDPSLLSMTSKSSPTPSATNFTSASVLVLYLGPVEIPDAWSKRELSSKCLQECTRNLLSQRQDFVEAFLEVTLSSMRILAVSQTELFKHKREELYYAGVCTDDELYFGIVTRKLEHKSNKKSSSGSGSSKVNRAHMCHVFKVIEQKSVLMLHSGAPRDSKSSRSNKQHQQQQPKQKTIPISSSVTIVNAIQGLFTSPGTKVLDDVVNNKISCGSAENVLSGCSQDKLKKKKLDVIDLRPSAYSSSSPLPSSSSSSSTGLIGSGLNSITQTTANMYVSAPYSGGSLPNNNRATSGVMISHVRSQSNPANTSSSGPGMPPPDYPRSIGTPAFHQQGASRRHGGSGGGGGGGLVVGGGGGGGSGTSWYASDSPKEEHHSRTESWDVKVTPPQGRRSGGRSPMGGAYDRNDGYYRHDGSPGSLGGHRHRGIPSNGRKANNHSPFQGDMVRRFSDDSSISSSLSDSRASSPTRISHRSSFTSHSRSPSPHRSLSFSSRSRTPSPLPPSRPSHSRPQGHGHGYKAAAGSRMSSSTRKARMEVGMSIRAASRTSSVMAANPIVPLRRQGSESSIMELQELKNVGGIVGGGPGIRGAPMTPSLPPKNGPLSSSIGSIATTIVDQVSDDPEECGKVAGWVASFDKLLADPLGVHTLTVFMKKVLCEENILFWKDTREFKETAATNKNLPASVKKIYDEYLSPTSPNMVNIDDRVKKSIESRMATPPLDIFNEAFEQIYQLMKMDCYPRFKKSALVKDCLMAEMEGNPLPIDLPQPQQQEQMSQSYQGIWKKHREVGFGRSLFSRFAKGRVQHQQQEPPSSAPLGPSDGGIWGASMEPKPPSSGSTSSTPDIKDGKRKKDKSAKDGSPRLRKTLSTKESKSKRKSAAGGVGGSGSGSGTESKPQSVSTSSPRSSNFPTSEDMAPEDHLNIFQAHKRNVFEVNLPNKVTKIMEVPAGGTVEQAIQPVLKKHGYSLDIMELRFANNLKVIDLISPASILIGQHISVIKSKNTFIASFPDVLERILPADGKKTVGELFVNLMREMGKLQNFSVAIEGARVGLDLETDTSGLIGQRVVVKYMPGPLIWRGENILEKFKDLSLKPSTGRTDMDDLFSMIERLSSDKLDDQSVSPTPPTPEQSDSEQQGGGRPLSGELPSLEMRRRSQTQGQLERGGGGKSGHKALTASKSTDYTDGEMPYSHHHHAGRDRRGDKHAHLRPPPSAVNSSSSSFGSDSAQFSRTHSGSSTNSGQTSSHGSSTSPTSGLGSYHRSLSPPGSSSYDSYGRERNTISPPPPTSKPPPLPSNTKKHNSGPRSMQQPPSRWSAPSTDSASSEDSLTADIPNHQKSYHQHHHRGEHSRSNMEPAQGYSRDQSSASSSSRSYHQQQQHSGQLPSNSGVYASSSDYHRSLDNVVKEAYRSSPSNQSSGGGSKGNAGVLPDHQQVSRKSSWQGQQQGGRAVDCSTTSHPLQTSVSRGHSQSHGGSLASHHHHSTTTTHTSYPRRTAHTLPNQQQKVQQASTQQIKRPAMPPTAAQRQELMENHRLIHAGEKLVQQEIDQYRKTSTSKNPKPGRSMDVRAHPSPETFV